MALGISVHRLIPMLNASIFAIGAFVSVRIHGLLATWIVWERLTFAVHVFGFVVVAELLQPDLLVFIQGYIVSFFFKIGNDSSLGFLPLFFLLYQHRSICRH
jgi:hypothetical protein